ncbi:MAG: hypothetical protein ACK4UN_15010, partial [Limisphaerales bacterium]
NKNPFDDRQISMDELLAFTTDHLQRLTSDNGQGTWTARITATSTALTQLLNLVSSDLNKLGVRKARKMLKDSFRANLSQAIAKIHAAVVAKFGPKSAQVLVCFPEGRKAFSACTDDQLANLLQTLFAGIETYESQLGGMWLDDTQALVDGWNLVYTASEAATGSKVVSAEAKRAGRDALQRELFKNLLTIALQFPEQEDKVSLYMQQSLLEDPKRQVKEGPTAPPPAA